jgi:hypothetical protein
MKRMGWLVLILALSLPALAGCAQPMPVASQETPFDALARRVPGKVETVFFLDFKPDGEAARHWERMRQKLEANPAGQVGLQGLFYEFRVEEYGLGEVILGPAVCWHNEGANYTIASVSDEQAAEDALRQYFEDVTWEQEEYEGATLYHARNPDFRQRRERLAWTVYDGLLFLSVRYDEEALTQLQALLSLAGSDSLAALPSWRALRDRLPGIPMGLIFVNMAEQARRYPPAPDDTSPGAALRRQLVALAFAAVPEAGGMRVDIAGMVDRKADAPPELDALLGLPAVDPVAWTGLPADTAIALIAHDASVLWPWLDDMFNLRALDQISDTVGLDLKQDLASAEGPLAGDFALAITPPLPEQPVIQGLPAGQLLILARGASEAQMADVQAAMEGRGAVFGPGETHGVALQTQAGTELAGYAISYGFDGDALLFGSSPAVIGRGVAARRDGGGLVKTPVFGAFLSVSPDDPSLVVTLNSESFARLMRANMTDTQYQENEEYRLLEVFEAIGLSLRLAPGDLDGVAYFFVR